jgi:signal recognition particle subunit SRP14
MVLLDNDQFLTEMTKMYQRNREKGSVWTTMKSSLCLNRPKRNAPKLTKEEEKARRCCLVRCTDGKKKISTRVYSAKAEKFAAEFTLVQKASMDGLKGKEKKKKGEKKTTKKPSANAANAAANAAAGGGGGGGKNKKKGKKK